MTLQQLIQRDDDTATCTATTAVTITKDLVSWDKPYKAYASALARDTYVIIFSDSFIEVFREVLSDSSGACIVKMTVDEKELYFDFLDYQNAQLEDPPSVGGFTGERLQALRDLDQCLYNETTCKTQSYLQQCFDSTHSWLSCVTC